MIFQNPSSHLSAVLKALLVTFLWSTSFIIIKFGLTDIPPLTFAGLRYFLAFLCLLPFVINKKNISEAKNFSSKDWLKLFFLGVIFYSITQGIQFVGLSILPAVTVSLLLNITPLVVAIMAVFLISEIPTILQWAGAVLFITGSALYFFPADFSSEYTFGILLMVIGIFANAASSILGRNINSKRNISPLLITVVSMGIGSVILLSAGILIQGLPLLSTQNIIYIAWLSLINTAFAFTLWNSSLRTLSAMESSIINGTMLIQIALLAFLFLGEEITVKEGIGMLIAASGAVLVQIKFKRKIGIEKRSDGIV